MKIAKAISTGLATLGLFGVAYGQNITTCEVTFDRGSVDFAENALDLCLNRINTSRLQTIHIMGARVDTENTRENSVLAQQRTQALRTAASSRLPRARVMTYSLGDQPDFTDARMIMPQGMQRVEAEGILLTAVERPGDAVAGTDDQTTDATTEETTTTAFAGGTVGVERPMSARIGLRAGGAHHRDTDEDYTAVGLDASVRAETPWVFAGTSILGEGALLGTALMEDNMDNHFASHVGVGPMMKYESFVAGGRLLLGGVYDGEDNDWDLDNGGELRIGIERNNISGFVSLARTREIGQISVDIGTAF